MLYNQNDVAKNIILSVDDGKKMVYYECNLRQICYNKVETWNYDDVLKAVVITGGVRLCYWNIDFHIILKQSEQMNHNCGSVDKNHSNQTGTISFVF